MIDWSSLRKCSSRATSLSYRRHGFSLIEAMVAMTIVTFAAAVLLLGVESSLGTSTEVVDRAIADGVARQLLDELTSKHYVQPGNNPETTALGPGGSEEDDEDRRAYNDTDDFHQYTTDGLYDKWGIALGRGNDAGSVRHPSFRLPESYFENWRMSVRVSMVNPTNPSQNLSGSSTSRVRAAEVTISYVQPDGSIQPLAKRRRVFAYLPPPN